MNSQELPSIYAYRKLCGILDFKVRSIDYKNKSVKVYSSSGLTSYTIEELMDMANEKLTSNLILAERGRCYNEQNRI